MNRFVRLALPAAACLWMSITAPAQTPAVPAAPNAQARVRAAQRGRAGMANLPVSAIDVMVNLSAEQQTKITAIEDKLKTDVAAAAGDRAKLRELRTAANDDIRAVLTEDQQKTMAEKLPIVQLLNQSKAVPSAALAAVKLTATQMDTIKTAASATREKMKAVPRADRRAKNPEILADFKTQVDVLLTADQKDAIAKAHRKKGHAARPAP